MFNSKVVLCFAVVFG